MSSREALSVALAQVLFFTSGASVAFSVLDETLLISGGEDSTKSQINYAVVEVIPSSLSFICNEAKGGSFPICPSHWLPGNNS